MGLSAGFLGVFQSTLPRRERHNARFAAARRRAISIHAPAKGATCWAYYRRGWAKIFQSTLPRRERPRLYRNQRLVIVFQSTLPRRERRGRDGGLRGRAGISIHAPAKGATSASILGGDTMQNFNPRSREGSDRMEDDRFPDTVEISIHAPAKGATVRPAGVCRRRDISIHAPAKGATRPPRRPANLWRFQSTLPRRERHKSVAALQDYAKFQSTLPRRERRR